METGRVLGILGAAILVIGAFSPIVSAPVVGSLTYFNNGRGDGVVILILAIIVAAMLILPNRHPEWTMVMGAAALGLTAGAFAKIAYGMSAMRSEMSRELAGNPFAGLAEAMVGSMQMQWGWALLIIGGLLIVFGPLIGKPSASARRIHVAAAAIGLILFGASVAVPFKAAALGGESLSDLQAASDPLNSGVPVSSSRPPSQWQVLESVSEMDGSRRVAASLQAVDSIPATWGYNRPSLILRCDGNRTNLYIDTKGVVASIYGEFDRSRVRWRIDDGAPTSQAWQESTDSQALFAPRPIAFARQLMDGESLLFEFTPYDSGPVTVKFDLSEMDNVVSRIAEACDWPRNN